MATRLYFRDTTVTGYATTEKSTALPSGSFVNDAEALRALSTTKGAAQTSDTANTLAQTAEQSIFMDKWLSDPLGVSQIAANTWQIGLGCNESNGAANMFLRLSVYVLKADDTVRGYIYDSATNLGAEINDVGQVISFAGNAVTGIVSTDRLAVEIWYGGSQGMAASYTVTFFYNGATDVTAASTSGDMATWVETPQDGLFGGGGITAAGAIASGEAFGIARITRLLQNVGAVTSAEAFGTTRPRFLLRSVGIASEEALGSPRTFRVLRPPGIASAEAFGTLTINRIYAAGAISSAEAFGVPRLVLVLRPLGTASAEAFGTARTIRTIRNAGGVPSAEAFGLDRLIRILGPLGISSAEAFGTTRPTRNIRNAGGISSAEAFGQSKLVRLLRAAGIASEEALGSPRIARIVYTIGITSQEGIGQPTITILGAPEPPAASVSGGVLVADAPSYQVIVHDGETYLVVCQDILLAEAAISDSSTADILAADALAASAFVSDRGA